MNHPLEVVETVLGVADVAWTAMEIRHNHHHDQQQQQQSSASEEEELALLRSENRRLRRVLEENLKLLQNLSESPILSKDCPPDLHTRLVAAVDSTSFLSHLESLHQASLDGSIDNFPFKQATDEDIHSAEIMVNVDHEEPSWWVWVRNEKFPDCVEERSGIDNEGYVIVSEELVVDSVANFLAKCIVSNPKAKTLTPEELQKTVASALGGMGGMHNLEKMMSIWHAGKMFYALSTWGLALAGLYRHRAVLKVAAKGIGASGKLLMKVL